MGLGLSNQVGAVLHEKSITRHGHRKSTSRHGNKSWTMGSVQTTLFGKSMIGHGAIVLHNKAR